jgi:hypothetical protein
MVSLLFIVLLYFLLKILGKDKNKAAIISSIFIILFFLFGIFIHIIPFSYVIIGGLVITSSFFLIVLWIDINLLAILIILKTKKTLGPFNGYLNWVSIFLVLLPIINIGIYEYKSKEVLGNIKAENYDSIKKNNNVEFPDIYYIVFDGYARADILKEIYGYDNSAFIDYLTNKGRSRANYPQSYLSIASSLNFDYINHISKIVGEESNDRNLLSKMIINNNVYNLLKNKGYLFVSVPGIWTGKNLYADIHIHAKKVDLNDFENALINLTPLGVVLGKKIQLNLRRENYLFSFKHIPDITEYNSSTFLYAHFLLPHPPFIFGKDGEAVAPKGLVIEKDGSHYFKKNPSKEEYRRKFKNQLMFVNKKAIEMIDEILTRSIKPPIIILQSDHGPGSMLDWEDPEKTNMKERLSILNAYYLPGEAKKLLYDSITPVNTFRVIFNYLFDTDFEKLDDKSYFATWDLPYKFIDVTEEVKGD